MNTTVTLITAGDHVSHTTKVEADEFAATLQTDGWTVVTATTTYVLAKGNDVTIVTETETR